MFETTLHLDFHEFLRYSYIYMYSMNMNVGRFTKNENVYVFLNAMTPVAYSGKIL